MTVTRQRVHKVEKLITGKDKVLQALKLGDSLRLITPASIGIPDRAWHVYAGVHNVEVENSDIKAIRLIKYLGLGNIGQLFFPIDNIVSLEGDLLTFNDYRLLKQSGVLG